MEPTLFSCTTCANTSLVATAHFMVDRPQPMGDISPTIWCPSCGALYRWDYGTRAWAQVRRSKPVSIAPTLGV